MAIPLNPPPRKEDPTFDNWVYRLWQSVQNAGIVNSAGSISISGDVTGTNTASTVIKINGQSLASLGTGILKNTTGTGVPSIALAATDYVAPSAYASGNGLTMSTSRILGRTTAGSGSAEEISVGLGLNLSTASLSVVPDIYAFAARHG